MSLGLYELADKKFYAIANVTVRLIGKFISHIALKADNTAHAPHLSKNIPAIPDPGLIFNPPESKVMPFPTNDII